VKWENEMNAEYYSRGKNVSDVGNTLEANWIPLSLIGVGIAWLVASNTGVAERVANDERVQTAGRRVREIAGDFGIGGATKHETGHGTQILGPDGRPLHRSRDPNPNGGWVDQASDAAREAMASVREAGTAVLDRATSYSNYGPAASDMAKRASGQMAEKLERNPWLIGIASMVAGALLAGLFPPTRIEQEYVDEARDGLWTKANQLGHQAAERVRELADSTTSERPSPRTW
jgi:hypothetical protein